MEMVMAKGNYTLILLSLFLNRHHKMYQRTKTGSKLYRKKKAE